MKNNSCSIFSKFYLIFNKRKVIYIKYKQTSKLILKTSVNTDAIAPMYMYFLNMNDIILVGDNIVIFFYIK